MSEMSGMSENLGETPKSHCFIIFLVRYPNFKELFQFPTFSRAVLAGLKTCETLCSLTNSLQDLCHCRGKNHSSRAIDTN